MARKADVESGDAGGPPPEGPVGPLLAANLIRLGYAETTVRVAEVARRITETTGRSMTRQRVSAILKATNLEPETIRMLAEALGVTTDELLRPIPEGGR